MLEDPPAQPTPAIRFARTAAGTVMAAALLGIRDVIEGERDDEPAAVKDWAGEPADDEILMRLDPDHPEDSIVIVRAPRFATDV